MSLEAKPSTGPADASAGDGQAIVHLVPHTHWDREWYEPFQVFRMRLVDLVDQLLERMAADPRLRFTLDGQAATVDDYLEIRPAAEPLIRRLIAERRLAIGPWQILLDEFLVSGETIVRNLELGWRRAEDLGGAMRVGYLPDMFGHVAQMPQLLRRAGIERAVVWRGVPSVIDRHTFTWLSPDGSWVETEYLVGGYGNGAYLFDVPSLLAPRLVGYRVDQASFYGERSLLAMYGTDHAVPTPELADLVERVNAAHGPVAGRARDPVGLPRARRAAPRRRPDPNGLVGRAPVRGPGQHAHERDLGTGRPEARGRPGRAPPRALCRAARRAARRSRRLARAPARARLAPPRRQLGARLDLRLLARPGGRPGDRTLRGGAPDRVRHRDPRPGPPGPTGARRWLGHRQPLAGRSRRPRRARRRDPGGLGVRRPPPRRPGAPHPGGRTPGHADRGAPGARRRGRRVLPSTPARPGALRTPDQRPDDRGRWRPAPDPRPRR